MRRQAVCCSILLMAGLAGCTGWRPSPYAARDFLRAEQPERVRVTRAGGLPLVLRHPTIRNDSIIGFTDEFVEVGVELGDGVMEVPGVDGGRTLLLVVALIPVGWLVAFNFLGGGL